MGELERLPLLVFLPLLRWCYAHWLLTAVVVVALLVVRATVRELGRRSRGRTPPRWIPFAWMAAGVVVVALTWGRFGAWSLLAFAVTFFVGFFHLGVLSSAADKRREALARIAGDMQSVVRDRSVERADPAA